MAKLTPKQERFVDEYLVDLNATAAARRAGYSEKTAEAIGYENLRKPQIMAAIQERQGELQGKLEITRETVLQELAAVAFANGTDFVTINRGGNLVVKATDQVPKEKLPAVAGIKYAANGLGVEIKLHDKVRALELLGKHLGIFDAKSGKPSGGENNLLSAIMGVGEIDTDDLQEVE